MFDRAPICGSGWLGRYNDLLRAGRSGDRILVGARFSTPVQTGPGTHPASYSMGTGSLSRGYNDGAWCRPPTPSSAEVKESVELYLYPPLGHRGVLKGDLQLTESLRNLLMTNVCTGVFIFQAHANTETFGCGFPSKPAT